MKRKTTKEIFAESFRELAESKTIDKITVKEIADNCSYSKATFYRHFKDIYDLIVWDYSRQTMEIMSRIDFDRYEWRQTLYDGANSFAEQKEYLANLILHTNGYHSFLQNMAEINYQILRAHILRATELDSLDTVTEMYVRLYCHGTVALTGDWILGKFDVAPQELAEVYEYSLPAPLKPYLYKK